MDARFQKVAEEEEEAVTGLQATTVKEKEDNSEARATVETRQRKRVQNGIKSSIAHRAGESTREIVETSPGCPSTPAMRKCAYNGPDLLVVEEKPDSRSSR